MSTSLRTAKDALEGYRESDTDLHTISALQSFEQLGHKEQLELLFYMVLKLNRTVCRLQETMNSPFAVHEPSRGQH